MRCGLYSSASLFMTSKERYTLCIIYAWIVHRWIEYSELAQPSSYIFYQYGVIFNKITFSNINLLNKALLTVVLVFLKVKIRKNFLCSIVSSENLLKLNHVKSFLCHLIRSFSNFSEFYLLWWFSYFFFVLIWNVCLLSYITLHHLYQLSQWFFVNLIYFRIMQIVL